MMVWDFLLSVVCGGLENVVEKGFFVRVLGNFLNKFEDIFD